MAATWLASLALVFAADDLLYARVAAWHWPPCTSTASAGQAHLLCSVQTCGRLAQQPSRRPHFPLCAVCRYILTSQQLWEGMTVEEFVAVVGTTLRDADAVQRFVASGKTIGGLCLGQALYCLGWGGRCAVCVCNGQGGGFEDARALHCSARGGWDPWLYTTFGRQCRKRFAAAVNYHMRSAAASNLTTSANLARPAPKLPAAHPSPCAPPEPCCSRAGSRRSSRAVRPHAPVPGSPHAAPGQCAGHCGPHGPVQLRCGAAWLVHVPLLCMLWLPAVAAKFQPRLGM